MKAVYFAWVRERIGKAEEVLAPPPAIVSVADLIGWLRGQGEGYEAAFAQAGTIRAALDRVHVRHEAPIAGAREVAFFPPMTGG